MNRLVMKIDKTIAHIENAKIPYLNYLITFFCIINLRNFIELFTHYTLFSIFNEPSFALVIEMFHFILFYVILAVLFIIVLCILTKECVVNISKIVLPSFVVLISVPLINLITSYGQGQHIYYILPNTKHSLLYYYATYFGDYSGISFALRFEVAIASLAACLYSYIKTKNILKSLLSMLLIYSIIFIMGSAPYIVQWFVPNLQSDALTFARSIMNYFLTLLFPLGIWLAYLINKNVFIAIIKDIRWLRLLHFELMLLFGMLIAMPKIDLWSIKFLFLAITTMFFWLFAVIINNIADQKIDQISNPNRPLIVNSIDLQTYKNIAYVSLCCCLIYALAVNIFSFMLIIGGIIASYLYSIPPFRFKRVLILSKLVISGVSFAMLLLGYYAVQDNLQGFPQILFWIFLVGYTLTINFIDIKDYAGDKAERIMTLPVVLGLRTAKLIIGLYFFGTSLALYWYIKKIYVLPILLLVGSLGFYFINQKEYRENKIFILYLSCMIALICKLLIDKLL